MEKAKLWEHKKISSCQGQGRGRDEQLSTEEVQGSETIVYNTTVMDTCYYTLVKTHEKYTKSEPECQLLASGDNNVSVWVHQV